MKGEHNMNELQIFNNPEFGDIRTVEINGEPWLVGKDVARALGYSNTKDALGKHVDPEDKRGSRFATPSGEQEMTIINESGLYSLVLSSKLPGAKKFKRWVTSEVLPAIRKRGGYLTPELAETMASGFETLTGTVQTMATAFEGLEKRVAALEQGRPELRALPPEPERNPFDDDIDNPFADDPPRPSSILARKLWMRLVNEKLDLLSVRYGKSNNAILHRIYQDMEERFNTVMDEERCRVMEEQGLEKCSVLLAIFFDPDLRDYFQRYVDHNLAPENRGW